MGESDLSRGKCWHGRGGVQWPALDLTALSAGIFLQAPFPSLLTASPAQERPAKLPSFLGKHIYPGQAHPRQPHNGPYQPWSQALRPSAHQVSHISCFHPEGQGWAQSGHILTGAKRRESTPPSLSPSRLSITTALTLARLGGALQQEEGVGVLEDLREEGRWTCRRQTCSTPGEAAPLESGAL